MLFKTNRSRRRSLRRFSGSRLGNVQALESRALLTGTVAITLTNAGALTITGDSSDNDVSFLVGAEGASVIGNDGTALKINGVPVAAGVEFHLADLVNNGITLKSITANLANGDDFMRVSINDGVSLAVGGNVTINTGNGDDGVRIDTDSGNLTIATDSPNTFAKLQVNLGAGDDFFDYDGFFFDGEDGGGGGLNIDGDVSVNGGAGNDDIILDFAGATVIGKNLTVDSAAGDDFVEVLNEDFRTNSSTSIGGNVVINLGAGNDTLAAGNSSDLFDFIFDFGDPDNKQPALEKGDNRFDVEGNVSVDGSSGDDAIALGGISTGQNDVGTVGDLTVRAGTGDDTVLGVELHVRRNLTVAGAQGNDDVLLDSIEVDGNTNLDMGDSVGNDRLIVQFADFHGSFRVSMGLGNDKFSLRNAFIDETTLEQGAVTINGGGGTDSIEIDNEPGDSLPGALGIEDFVTNFENFGVDAQGITNAIIDEFQFIFD